MSVAERYVELCLRIARHDGDLLDFYFGPREIAERVEQEQLREPAQLVADAGSLAEETDSAFLRAQLRGLETVSRKLAGEELSYGDEVERCYGTTPERVPEERFEAAHQALDEVLPSGATLRERYQRWEDGDPLPAPRIEAVLMTLGERLRGLAQELVGLPEGETFEVELVNDKHWLAYNHYLGGLRSRIDANTDLPITAKSAAELMAHELYPGHHTEHAWKELLLYEGLGRLEESVFPYGTPQSVIGEGIATLAVETVVEDHGEFVADIFGELGIDYDAEGVRRVRQAAKPLHHVLANAAILLHVDGVPADEVTAYVRQWMLASEQRAEQYVQFVTDQWGRTYIRTYTDGYDLCRNWVAGDMARFKRLLTEQLTPADLT